MKNLIPILAFSLFLLVSCTKSDPIEPIAEVKTPCVEQTQARVEYMIVNEDGTDGFYYLVMMDAAGNDLTNVYPNNLPVNLRQEGALIDINFGKTGKMYQFIVCLAGHQIDPANPDYQEMARVNLCNAESSKN